MLESDLRKMFKLLGRRETTVFNEISYLVYRSSTGWRGRSFAASASVLRDTPKENRSRKWVSKDERRTMVESFVDKYREMNSGKFPTASEARKEVGGSYYFIRKILQEIEHNSKISNINMRIETSWGKVVTKASESSPDVEEVVNGQMRVDVGIHKDAQTVAINDVDTGDSSCKHSEVKEGLLSILDAKTLLEEDAKGSVAVNDVDTGDSGCKPQISILNAKTLVIEDAKGTVAVNDVDTGDSGCKPQISISDAKTLLGEDAKGALAVNDVETGDSSCKPQISISEAKTLLEEDAKNMVAINVVDTGDSSCRPHISFSNVKALMEEDAKGTVAVNDVDTSDSNCKHSEVKDGPQILISGLKTLLEDDAKGTATVDNSEDVKGEAEEVSHPCPEKPDDDIKVKTPSEDVTYFDDSMAKPEQHQQSPEIKKSAGDLSKKLTDEVHQKKSSMWGNLKSLAGGIFNFWRKL